MRQNLFEENVKNFGGQNSSGDVHFSYFLPNQMSKKNRYRGTEKYY